MRFQPPFSGRRVRGEHLGNTEREMSSSSSGKERGPKSPPGGGSERKQSFAKLFRYLLVGFFLIQLVVGIAVIVLFIGREMSRMQEAGVRSELENRRQFLEIYLNDRLMLLEDYSRLPAVIAGVIHSDGSSAKTAALFRSLRMLQGKAFFCLQDSRGAVIYSSPKSPVRIIPEERFQILMHGELGSSVDVIEGGREAGDGFFWRLSVPVIHQGAPAGVLSAFLSIHLEDILLNMTDRPVRMALLVHGEAVLSLGEVPQPVVSHVLESGFPGIGLLQEVSRQDIDRRIEFLVSIMVAALVAGTGVMFVVVRMTGKKLLVVPHTRLEAMHDELEREVEARTADLMGKTDQLFMEIRERREAETQARETEQLVSALLEGIGAAFFIINPVSGNIIRSNSVVQSMFGLAPWQLSDRSCSDAFSDGEGFMAELACPESAKNGAYMEGVARNAEGQSFPVSRYLVPMEIQGEEHIGVIMMDITERKNLERRLNIAQKLESVGELASGIAHEINTPIQYVGDSIRFVQEAMGDIAEIMRVHEEVARKCGEEGKFRELVERLEKLADDADLEFVVEEIPKACNRALEGIEQVAVIVRAMKNFAHPGDGEMSAVDINRALENTILVSKNEWKYVADVEKNFGDIPLLPCLPGDMNQVFLNILINAAHAINDVVGNSGKKGTITISTSVNENEVFIRISDTGAGIPPENRDKIFDPFFTTKEVGRGTGQGLAIVHDIIVERHGGSIDFESEVGRGTTFIIGLPLGKE